MRVFQKTLLAALMLGLASPAMAATTLKPSGGAGATGVTSDVRCLLVMAALGQDKQRSQAAMIGAYFFMGRINARAPTLDVPAAVKAEAAKLKGQSLSEEAKRCGPMVEAGMHTLQTTFGGPPRPAAAAPPTASGLPPAIPPAAPAAPK